MLLLQTLLRHPADALGLEVLLLGEVALEAAQLLVALLLPLGDKIRVAVLVLEQELVQLA